MKARHWVIAAWLCGVGLGCQPTVGSDCSERADCEDTEGVYCAVTGICTAPCAREGDTCMDEGVCVDVGTKAECVTNLTCEDPARMVCLRKCTGDSQCRDAERCTSILGGAGACVLVNLFAPPEDPESNDADDVP